MPKLLDQYGDPISTKPPANARSGGAVAVRQQQFNYPISGLTPGKLVRILRESDDGYLEDSAELYAEMEERDGHLMSQMEIRKNALAGLEWRVTPADSSANAKRIADAFADWWNNSDQSDLILDCADAIMQGVNITTMAWERTGGTWFPARFEQVAATNLRFDRVQRRFQVLTVDAPTGMTLPYGAGIEHRARARVGSPTRAGLGRTLAWWYLFKHYGVKDWMVFAELFGVPFRIGKYDPSTGEAERAALEAAVRGLGSDAAGVISRDTEIEIIEIQKTGGTDVFEKLIALSDREISKAVLGQTLTSSEGSHGTQALGTVHQRVRFDIRDADCKRLAPTLRRDLLEPFTLFNFGAENFALAPRLVPILEEPEDLEGKAKTLKTLQDMGLEIPEAWVRETFGVPAIAAGDRALGRAAPAPQTRALEAYRRQVLEAETVPGVQEGQAYALGLIGNGTEAARAVTGEVIARITQIVADADSPEGLRDALILEYPSLPTARLSAILEHALTLAELSGRYAARVGEL